MKVLDEAISLVEGDRQRDYDSPAVNFDRIIRGWEVILGIPITLRQFMWMMVWLKAARDVGTPKRDNVVDAAGYIHAYDLTGEQI